MTPQEIIAAIGIVLGFFAKHQMAESRLVAIKILFVSTVIAAAWSFYLQDWFTVALHVGTCYFARRTYRAWKRNPTASERSKSLPHGNAQRPPQRTPKVKKDA